MGNFWFPWAPWVTFEPIWYSCGPLWATLGPSVLLGTCGFIGDACWSLWAPLCYLWPPLVHLEACPFVQLLISFGPSGTLWTHLDSSWSLWPRLVTGLLSPFGAYSYLIWGISLSLSLSIYIYIYIYLYLYMYMYMRRLVHMHAQGKDLREDIYTAGGGRNDEGQA